MSTQTLPEPATIESGVSGDLEGLRRGRDVNIELEVPPVIGSFRAELVDKNGDPLDRFVVLGTEIHWRCHWWLRGSLPKCICGYWCCAVHFESIGAGPELSFTPRPNELTRHEPCRDEQHYWTDHRVPDDEITADHCGPVYKVLSSLQFLTECKYKDADEGETDPSRYYVPAPIGAYYPLGKYQFLRSGK